VSKASNLVYLDHAPTTPIMASPTVQYVYIPNLVGRQMLRIPLDEVEAEGRIASLSSGRCTTAVTTNATPHYARRSSLSPSIKSVDSIQSAE